MTAAADGCANDACSGEVQVVALEGARKWKPPWGRGQALASARFTMVDEWSGCSESEWYTCPSQERAGATSATGTRTRVARVRAEYPDQLDYSGFWVADET